MSWRSIPTPPRPTDREPIKFTSLTRLVEIAKPVHVRTQFQDDTHPVHVVWRRHQQTTRLQLLLHLACYVSSHTPQPTLRISLPMPSPPVVTSKVTGEPP